MPRPRSRSSLPSLLSGRYSLLALVVAGLLALARWKGWIADPTKPHDPGDGRGGGGGGRVESRETVRKSGGWEEWHGCRLIEDRGNDGDSFLVESGDGQRAVIRLYFADCPEKTRHQYNGQRIAEQGRYFGGLTEEETVALGEEARDFTLGLLRQGGFSVLTRREAVYDSERIYAFVEVPAATGAAAGGKDGAGGKVGVGGKDVVEAGDGSLDRTALTRRDLGELLVEEGMARIHTSGAARPGTKAGMSVKAGEQRLRNLERKAKSDRLGGWGKRRPQG